MLVGAVQRGFPIVEKTTDAYNVFGDWRWKLLNG